MDGGIGQHRPAPQFEQQRAAPVPASAQVEPPDLDGMALRLDQMKVEAAIDAERTRPGLNGLFTLVLVGGGTFVAAFIAQYRERSFDALSHVEQVANVQNIAIAVGVGVVAALIVAIASYLAQRRTRAVVRAYEAQLIALGGTPLPERGLPMRRGRR